MTSGESDLAGVSGRGSVSDRAVPSPEVDPTGKAADGADGALDVSHAGVAMVRLSRFLFYGGAAVVLILDQITKAWVVANLPQIGRAHV